MRFAPLLLVLLSFQDPPAEPAGALAWKLGKNDFARYNATRVTIDRGDESEFGNPSRLVGLFGYELTDKTTYRPETFNTLEIPLMLGLSLPPKQLKPGQSHEWLLELDQSFDCGALTIKCTAARSPAVDIDMVTCVKLDLTARISRSLKAAPAKPIRTVEKGRFEGTLYFDPAKGVARRLDFSMNLTMAPADPKGAVETIETRERLQLEEVLTLRHRAFESEVNAAIDKGVEYVWRCFNRGEGRWGAHYEHATGPTALALLTILKGTTDRKDERILKALDWLLSQPLQHTYDVAISLMALEAFYSPGDATAKSAADKDIPGRMDPGHARWGASALKWIEMNLAKAMWSYPSTDVNARDFSNTQYGVLGLYSASRCGFQPDLGVVRRVQETYLRAQQKKGPRTELALQEAETLGSGSKSATKYIVEARGWPYYDDPNDPVYGSMTAGGVSSLVILDALRRKGKDGKYEAKEQVQVRAAIRDGWGWLATHWTVKANPVHGHDWLYYYLYGIERCAMLDGVARLGDHDWYWEGATFLVSNQATDGTWMTGKYLNMYDNCFAILFLKRATVRVATGK